MVLHRKVAEKLIPIISTPSYSIPAVILALGVWGTGLAPRSLYDRPARKIMQASPPPMVKRKKLNRAIKNYIAGLENESTVPIKPETFRRIFKTPEKRKTRKQFQRRPRNFSRNSMQAHTVAPGQTLRSIARKYGIPPKRLLRDNPHLRHRLPQIKERLLIVKQRHRPWNGAFLSRRKKIYYRVRPGDNLLRIARRYRTSVKRLRRWNKLKGSFLPAGRRLLVARKRIRRSVPRGWRLAYMFHRPVQGRITSYYGRRRNPFSRRRGSFHRGLDIGAAMGAPITASRAGLVVFAGRTSTYGNCVRIRHAGGYTTVYAHASRVLVRAGDVVNAGRKIAEIGRTGHATGPHIHFEVHVGNRAINPLTAFRKREIIRRN